MHRERESRKKCKNFSSENSLIFSAIRSCLCPHIQYFYRPNLTEKKIIFEARFSRVSSTHTQKKVHFRKYFACRHCVYYRTTMTRGWRRGRKKKETEEDSLLSVVVSFQFYPKCHLTKSMF